MNDQEINIAIAELCGWTKVFSDEWGPLRGLKSGDKFYAGCAFTTVPDYLNDLNAMHEAEKVLVGKNNWELCEYVHKLHTATNSWIAFATARQRAEAFLRTLGKWKE
jgi:hypothetical protein